ncbi:hypothetical protein PVAG01_07398 [Phlyctema vagabunda]|uniref:Uncharacterized protein n=1 Tax=Phlyctema vagabunda TaxID=108571 RepID=A0ABR4PCD2_9HELO
MSESADPDAIASLQARIAKLVLDSQRVGGELRDLESLHEENKELAKKNDDARDKLSAQLDREHKGIAERKELMDKSDKTVREFKELMQAVPGPAAPPLRKPRVSKKVLSQTDLIPLCLEPTAEHKFRMAAKEGPHLSTVQRTTDSLRSMVGLGQSNRIPTSSDLHKLAESKQIERSPSSSLDLGEVREVSRIKHLSASVSLRSIAGLAQTVRKVSPTPRLTRPLFVRKKKKKEKKQSTRIPLRFTFRKQRKILRFREHIGRKYLPRAASSTNAPITFGVLRARAVHKVTERTKSKQQKKESWRQELDVLETPAPVFVINKVRGTIETRPTPQAPLVSPRSTGAVEHRVVYLAHVPANQEEFDRSLALSPRLLSAAQSRASLRPSEHSSMDSTVARCAITRNASTALGISGLDEVEEEKGEKAGQKAAS